MYFVTRCDIVFPLKIMLLIFVTVFDNRSERCQTSPSDLHGGWPRIQVPRGPGNPTEYGQKCGPLWSSGHWAGEDC